MSFVAYSTYCGCLITEPSLLAVAASDAARQEKCQQEEEEGVWRGAAGCARGQGLAARRTLGRPRWCPPSAVARRAADRRRTPEQYNAAGPAPRRRQRASIHTASVL